MKKPEADLLRPENVSARTAAMVEPPPVFILKWGEDGDTQPYLVSTANESAWTGLRKQARRFQSATAARAYAGPTGGTCDHRARKAGPVSYEMPSPMPTWLVTVRFYDGDSDDFGRPRVSRLCREQCAPSGQDAYEIVRARIDGEVLATDFEPTFAPCWGNGNATCGGRAMSYEITADVWYGFKVPADTKADCSRGKIPCEVTRYGCAVTGEGGMCVRVVASVSTIGMGGCAQFTGAYKLGWDSTLKDFCEAHAIPWPDDEPTWYVSVSRS